MFFREHIFSRVVFSRCVFSRHVFSRHVFSRVVFSWCVFSRAVSSRARGLVFVRAVFSQACVFGGSCFWLAVHAADLVYETAHCPAPTCSFNTQAIAKETLSQHCLSCWGLRQKGGGTPYLTISVWTEPLSHTKGGASKHML